MITDTKALISSTDLSRSSGTYIDRASAGCTFVVLKNNNPTAAIVPMSTMERISRIDELEDDMRLLSVAVTRVLTDDGKRYSLDEVAAEFGIDLDEED